MHAPPSPMKVTSSFEVVELLIVFFKHMEKLYRKSSNQFLKLQQYSLKRIQRTIFYKVMRACQPGRLEMHIYLALTIVTINCHSSLTSGVH